MSAPMPVNFDALTSAWDDPYRYAAELAKYHDQLVAAGFRESDRDRIKESE